MKHERIARGVGHPFPGDVRPRPVVDPVAENRGKAAVAQMVGSVPDDHATDTVARQGAVAVRVRGVGRDDERRIARDHVEALVRHGCEPASLPALHVRRLVQRRVEAREGQRARIHVDGDDRLAVAGEEEPLGAASGSEIEGPLRRPAQREMCEGLAGRHDAEHAIGPAGGKVAGHDQITMRTEEATRMGPPVAEVEETELLEVRDAQGGEGGLGLVALDG